MHAVKKMATRKHPKDVPPPPHVEMHEATAHPPKHKTLSCALKMAVKKSD